ncbi:PQQ-dependent sugar dehydrogenase [Arundinibacter roseus]|uniref:C-type cytochrome n=1 Tax=Arundinibacter roseus TaxID=2070510 RepID=A0A4R4KC85_9BACT|nr:PQQ-dependent sugar dehydrogenase [Arundinibacter roseus]TDB65283.1 c-type cytochrome [Arundinibacter roseus]
MKQLRYVSLPVLALLLGLINCTRTQPGSTAATGHSTQPAPGHGKELFTTHCVSCHSLTDDGIGPRLGGITKLKSEQALLDFIKNPAKAIESGDLRAVSQFQKYKLMMPPFDYLDDASLRSIVAYIDKESTERNLTPLVVETKDVAKNAAPERLIAPVQKSNLKIELEDFVTFPATSPTPPKTRIATMRSHPSANGSLFVSDQRGIIYRINQQQIHTFLDIRPLLENYTNVPGLGTGLGSFAFHPDFLENGLMYITHTEKFAGKPADYEFPDSIKVALQWVLSEWKMNSIQDTVFQGERRELLRINVPGSVHGTQDIGFTPNIPKNDPDYGMLYIGTGDGGSTIGKHPELTHTLRSLLGTIIRIDPRGNNSRNGNYGIPADNPFVNNSEPGVYKEIWAYGFRNPHRLAWHQHKGERILLSAEVGEVNVEEINHIVKGGDYGWNQREGSFGISTKNLKQIFPVEDAPNEHFIKPFAQYDHIDGNAVSGGYVYEGALKELQDLYIFGDIVRGRLFYLSLENGLTDPVIRELFITQNGQLTDLVKMTNTKRVDLRIVYDEKKKEMFIMTKSDGKLRRISKAYRE